MAPSTPIRNTRITRSTPLRQSMEVSSSSPSDSIVIDTTLQVYDSAIDTPNTRKRQRVEYQNLYKYGFQGPPITSPKPDPPIKKVRILVPAKARATRIPEDNEVEEDDLNEDEDILLKKQNTTGKRAW